MAWNVAKTETRTEFEGLTLPHLDSLYGGALRMTRNERDAEDLVQDTILRAFRFFHRFERGSNIKAWLFKILTNTFVNKYRKGQREQHLLDKIAAEEAATLYSDAAHKQSRDPESVLGSRLLSEHLVRALESLPEEFRVPVVLADLEDFSYREIADIMDCPVGTVMSRLHRGRRLLQRKLAGFAAEQGVGADAPVPVPVLTPRLKIVKTEE